MDQPSFIGMFTKDEATAAQRTFTFLAVDVTDGFTPEAGLAYAGADCQISKNGAALANLAGAVTEISAGLYKVVLAAGDVDTLGTFVISFADAAARTAYVCGQVAALDLNVATVNPGADGITAATLATSAGAEISGIVADELEAVIGPSRVTGPHAMGTRTTNGAFTALSTLHAIDADVTVTGTWDGATATVQTCADVTATVPVWSTYDDGAGPNPMTANGTVRVSGPYPGVRVNLSAAGAGTSLVASATMRSN